jgi:hypothetical protein
VSLSWHLGASPELTAALVPIQSANQWTFPPIRAGHTTREEERRRHQFNPPVMLYAFRLLAHLDLTISFLASSRAAYILLDAPNFYALALIACSAVYRVATAQNQVREERKPEAERTDVARPSTAPEPT